MKRTARRPELCTLQTLLLLAAVGSGGACKESDPGPPPANDTPDLSVPVRVDMARPAPDFGSLCAYGQSMTAGVCSCDSDHPEACGGGYCCASGQQCLAGATPRCSGPAARQRLAMAYDPQRGVTVLSGGQCDNNVTGTEALCADQWQLNPTTFHPVSVANGPSPRSGARLSFDGVSTNLLLFGGQLRIDDINAMSDETWLFDGSAWAQNKPAQSPPARAMAGLAYDTVRRRTVLYGGVANGDMALDDTWEWDGTSWAARTFANSPTAREGHGLVYDQKHGKVVMHGGLAAGSYVSDTWVYDGSTWNQAPPVGGMPPRGYFGMAYDSDRGVVVIHGGDTPGLLLLADTWEWDGTTWKRKLTPQAPPVRVGASMIYDPSRKLTLLFGGVNPLTGLYNDLWGFDGTTWKQLY